MTPEQLAALIRLQGTAREVLAAARAVEGRGHVQLSHVGEQLAVVINEVAQVVEGTPLSEEFGRVVPRENQIFWRDVEPRAAALLGWIGGAIDAESFTFRIETEARALAEARVREERRVGSAGLLSKRESPYYV